MEILLVLCIIAVLIQNVAMNNSCRMDYDQATSRILFEMDWVPNSGGMPGRPGKRGLQGLKGDQGLRGIDGQIGNRGLKGEKGEVPAQTIADMQRRLEKVEHNTKYCGWTKVDGRFAYQTSTTQMTWGEAKSYCETIGGKLASKGMRDSTVLDFVQENIVNADGNDHWIGIHDKHDNGRFVWIDNVQSTRQNTPWAPGEPSDAGTGHCVQLANRRNSWEGIDDTRCSIGKKALCEAELLQ